MVCSWAEVRNELPRAKDVVDGEMEAGRASQGLQPLRGFILLPRKTALAPKKPPHRPELPPGPQPQATSSRLTWAKRRRYWLQGPESSRSYGAGWKSCLCDPKRESQLSILSRRSGTELEDPAPGKQPSSFPPAFLPTRKTKSLQLRLCD